MSANPYASFLGQHDPLTILASTPARIRTLTAALTPEQLSTPPAPGKWSIREIAAHWADCELVFSFRLRQTLATPPTEHYIIQPFDQDRWAAHYAAYEFAPALALFTATRNWNVALISSISTNERTLPATHPERGPLTFWTIVETMAGHDVNHLQQLERLTA